MAEASHERRDQICVLHDRSVVFMLATRQVFKAFWFVGTQLLQHVQELGML